MVVQPGERNAYDQQARQRPSLDRHRSFPPSFHTFITHFSVPTATTAQWIQLQLWERHGLRTLRLTLKEISEQASARGCVGVCVGGAA